MKIKFNLSEFSVSGLTRTFTIASIMASVIALFSGPVYAQSYDATTQAGQEIKFEYELSIAPNWQLRYTVKNRRSVGHCRRRLRWHRQKNRFSCR